MGPLPIDEMMGAAEKALDDVLAKIKPQYPNVAALIANGDPWDQILAKARQLHVDLIVMGTHGRRGLPRLLIGSVAERVVRTSTLPVLTVSSHIGSGD
jgi:nucleotide-binding universal stress UspA family protein